MQAALVSILIPVYNSPFFEAALRSALAQTYPHIEIIVSDDSDLDAAESVVAQYPDARLRYIRNTPALGFHGNFSQCFAEARGEYIKFLNHDDLLHLACVATMVRAFEVGGKAVSLVASSRQVIDAQGKLLAGNKATEPLFQRDSMVDGHYLGDLCLRRSTNLIGEPTTAMFRHRDIELIEGALFRFKHRDYTCLADLCLWLRLLASGKLAYLCQPLSMFRQHADQLQATAAAQCILERFYLPEEARAHGYLTQAADYRAALSHAVKLGQQYQNMQGLNLSDQAELLALIHSTQLLLSP